MIARPPDNATVRWPAERFFWAVLDAPGLRVGGELPSGLADQFADDVPIPAEELHAVCAPSGDGRAVVCGVRCTDLESADGSLTALTPAELPPGARVQVDPGTLNLLVGRFEPVGRRRGRTRTHLILLAAVTATLALVTVGLLRRAAHWESAADTAHEASQTIIRRVAPGANGRPEAVAVELVSTKQATDALSRVAPTPDAALALVELLKAWPASVPCKPQAVEVGEGAITVSVVLEGEAGPLLKAFAPPHGWVMDEPRLNGTEKLMRVSITLRPTKGGTP